MLDKILPIMLACTRGMSPLTSARIEIKSYTDGVSIDRKARGEEHTSTALPKLAFNNPPMASPTRRANCSVAKLNKLASGMTERKVKTKTMTSFWCVR